MQRILFSFLLLSFLIQPLLAQQKLLGRVTEAQLSQAPFDSWYLKGRDNYQADKKVIKALKKEKLKHYRLQLYFGSWCGDSRRELPRMMKVLHEAGYPINTLEIIAVDNQNMQYKQSPGGEEKGLGIYRVPTLRVLSKKGEEIGRIIERPLISVEKDLLSILNGEEYATAYPALASLYQWQTSGKLIGTNTDMLAKELKPLVKGHSELASAALKLYRRGFTKEAIQTYKLNEHLFPDSFRSHKDLARIYEQEGHTEEAIRQYKKALEIMPDNAQITSALNRLQQQAKG